MPKPQRKPDYSLNPVELIRRKRDGEALSAAEISGFIAAFNAGRVAEYQMSAWLMAAFLRGLNDDETAALTDAMLHSGDILDLSSVRAPKVDKHSTGGVGDKISICLAPLVACAGVAVPMIAGRGLGYTGGTLDKLEAIPGYRVGLTAREFERTVREVGTSMIGQTHELVPADRRIYALRDVTATVECVPLIVASILSKKLAEGIDGLVLDVKFGRGAFMKDQKQAEALAHAISRVGKRAGKRVVALITDMNTPIGLSIGNALETREAIDVLNNQGPEDTRELTLALGIEMLLVARVAESTRDARSRLERALADGSAFERFLRMVKAHGGDTRAIENPSKLPRARVRLPILAKKAGYLADADAYELAMASLALGAGRTRADQKVDAAAGIELCKTIGERVARGEPLAWLHAASKTCAESQILKVERAFAISRTRVSMRSRVVNKITR